jgi:hypothetical protein
MPELGECSCLDWNYDFKLRFRGAEKHPGGYENGAFLFIREGFRGLCCHLLNYTN